MDTIFTDTQVEGSATDTRVATADEYLNLVRRSGLVPEPELGVVHQGFQAVAKRRGSDAASLAYYLLQLKLVTPWQTKMLLQGRYKGFILAQYKILDRIGAGGMGSVFLAEHAETKQQVAIKVLYRDHNLPYSRVQRFLAECKAAASLDHPNIVHSFHFDQEFDHYYLVMEHLEGVNLQQKVEREGPLPFRTAAHYIRQAALGLAHAHAAALIHRDVKPANLVVDKRDCVKLLDLGLAHHLDSKSGSLTSDRSTKVVGTADYVAPEQVQDSHNVDARTDVYGLGATFYFLLTGTPPFPDGNLAHKLAAQLYHHPPAIRERRPDIPAPLQSIVEKMMAKRPSERFASAEAVAAALAQWLETGTFSGYAPTTRRSASDTIDAAHVETYHPSQQGGPAANGAATAPGAAALAAPPFGGQPSSANELLPPGLIAPRPTTGGGAAAVAAPATLPGAVSGRALPPEAPPAGEASTFDDRPAWRTSEVMEDDDPPKNAEAPPKKKKRPRRRPGESQAWHPVMTVEEVSEYLRLPEDSVRTLAVDGRIPCQMIAGEHRFHKKAIDQWLQEASFSGSAWGGGKASWDGRSTWDGEESSVMSSTSLRLSRGELLDLLTRVGIREGETGRKIAHLSDNNPSVSVIDFCRLLVENQILNDFQYAALLRGELDTLRLDDYLILDRLAIGGSATVFRARDLRTKNVMALKVLQPDAFADAEERKRFEQEVQIATTLNHPNIVMAFGGVHVSAPGEANGRPADPRHYLVMECVEGTDLNRKVRSQGPLAVRQAVDYILQAARGLQYAHQRDLVHRDVKPSNLLVDEHGAVKILDLGLARCEQNWLRAATEPPDRLTRQDSVLGTPDFMAPEQFMDPRNVDSRADVYSLGCTLCFLLTGQPPFPVTTATKAFRAHQMEPTPNLTALRAEIPASLQHVFQRMMQKNPAHRYASLEQVMEDLESLVIPDLQRSRSGAMLTKGDYAAPLGAPPRPQQVMAEFMLVSVMGFAIGSASGLFCAVVRAPGVVWLGEAAARANIPVHPTAASLFLGAILGLLAGAVLFWGTRLFLPAHAAKPRR